MTGTSDPIWEKSVRSVVDSMSRPLVTSGWQVRVLGVDAEANSVSVLLVPAQDCDECVMSDEDFAGLLEETLRRTHEGISVSVNR